MISEERMKELQTARETLEKATREEKQALFSSWIEQLAEHKTALSEKENTLYPHNIRASQAFNLLSLTLNRFTGYKVGWVRDALTKHNSKGGRPHKYSDMDYEVNCFFITHMVKRGSSTAQAIKLLARLRGDTAMSEGHLKGLRQTYNNYKALGRPSEDDEFLFCNGWEIAEISAFSIENLEGSERASQKAVEAFRLFWGEIIVAMKALEPSIAEQNKGNLGCFGHLIPALSVPCEDPLDHIYVHLTLNDDPIDKRKHWLKEYINDIYGLMV